jgi:hypothetical protein
MRRGDDSRLRYVEAARLQVTDGNLRHVDFRDADDQKIGTLDGVVIDPASRRLRFFVVESSGWFKSRRFLLPAEWPARIDTEKNSVRVDVDAQDLGQCEEFDRATAPRHSDDDLIQSLFHHRVA